MSHLDEGTLHALLDGEIPSTELGPIQAHLAACAECRGRLEEERALLTEADGLVELVEVEPGTQAVPPQIRSRFRMRELAWAASVVLALGAGYVLRGAPAPASDAAATLANAPAQRSAAPVTPTPPAAETALAAPAETIRPEPLRVRRPSNTGGGAASGRTSANALATNEAALDKLSDSAAKKATQPDSGRAVAEREARPITGQAAGAPSVAAAPPPLTRLQAAEPRRDEAAKSLGLTSSVRQDAPAEIVTLSDALRRLGGTLRLIDGMVALRVEAQGPYVRVIYPTSRGELALQQRLVDGRVRFEIIAPAGYPADSVAKLKARVRE